MTAPFKTLMLTGAAGFVGRHLAPALLPLATRLRVSDLPEVLSEMLSEVLTRTPLPAGVQAVPCACCPPAWSL